MWCSIYYSFAMFGLTFRIKGLSLLLLLFQNKYCISFQGNADSESCEIIAGAYIKVQGNFINCLAMESQFARRGAFCFLFIHGLMFKLKAYGL